MSLRQITFFVLALGGMWLGLWASQPLVGGTFFLCGAGFIAVGVALRELLIRQER